MDCLRVMGGVPLGGTVRASGSKNAALPIMAASILTDGVVTLVGVPKLADVDTLALLLGNLGVEVTRLPDGTLNLQTVDSAPTRANYELVRRMRASFCVLGPLVARRARAIVSLPGGCQIGTRPVDLHLKGLAALGADLRIERGHVIGQSRRLRGATIDLDGPHGPTVTGTANVMSAAALALGKTVITSAAVEPEVVDLGRFLISMGAEIEGLGTTTIEIKGVEQLRPTRYRIISDRIEAGTLLIAAATTKGSVTVQGLDARHLTALLDVLTNSGASVSSGDKEITVCGADRLRPLTVTARPYPGVPTDLQAQLTVLATQAHGRSIIRDTVFPSRFLHVDELNRLGASIERCGSTATVRGRARLSGAAVAACDLRASAALILAGLAAQGRTVVRRIHHLDRGYERLERKLSQLGARITRHCGDTPADRLDVASRADASRHQSPAAVAGL
jgi:UDP-N-acetylglucosamine 1-carboxyvinyltransferase